MKKRKITFASLILIAILASYPLWNKTNTIEVNNKQEKQNEKEDKDLITLLFTGDIMLDRGVELKMEEHDDWKWPFLKTADFLKSADLTFGNLESVISDKGTKVGSIYSFRANPLSIEGLTLAGFDVVSLANNHAFDYTVQALTDTMVRLKLAGIDFIGADLNKEAAFSPIIKDVKGVKIGFLAYIDLGPKGWRATESSPGIAWIEKSDFPEIQKDISEAKKEVDILVVSLHAGTEYETIQNQSQEDFAKMAIDAGADLLIGHHPHVIQPYEKYGDGWIFYSLGNFIFDQDFSTETSEGEIAKVIIKDKKIKEVSVIKTKINESLQPEIID